jgi:FkbM family methyltransferase
MAAQDDDLPFRHYSAKQQVVAWISQTLFDRVTYTVRHGLLQGMKRRGGLGWVPSSTPQSKEEIFWAALNLQGQVVYDIGAFHGILTLFFARQAARVISYEPNSRNHARLLENIRINALSNVTVRKLGLGAAPETATLVYMPLMSGGGSLEQKTVEQLRTSKAATVSEQIEISTLDQDIASAKLPPPDFIKIDVEGWELEVLKGARQTLADHRPALFLEMHGETMNEKKRKVAAIVAFLTEAGYQNIQHVESGTLVDTANTRVAAEGHLYCLPDRK